MTFSIEPITVWYIQQYLSCKWEYFCYFENGPLARYVKLWVAHAPGMPGTFSPFPLVSDPDMHHGTCVTHVPWCMPGSLISGLLFLSQWRGKRSRHSRRMRIRQLCVSGKRPMRLFFSPSSSKLCRQISISMLYVFVYQNIIFVLYLINEWLRLFLYIVEEWETTKWIEINPGAFLIHSKPPCHKSRNDSSPCYCRDACRGIKNNGVQPAT